MSPGQLQFAYDTAQARVSDLSSQIHHIISSSLPHARSRLWESADELAYLLSRTGLIPDAVRSSQRRHEHVKRTLEDLESKHEDLCLRFDIASIEAQRAWEALWRCRCERPEDFGVPGGGGETPQFTGDESDDGEWSDDDEDEEMEDEDRERYWREHFRGGGGGGAGSQGEPSSSQAAFGCETFLAEANRLLSDYSALTSFPEPPATNCGNPSCRSEPRALRACSHDLESVFSWMSTDDLKSWRVRFHPDKFSQVPEVRRAEMQRKAQEVFVVVDRLYQARRRN